MQLGASASGSTPNLTAARSTGARSARGSARASFTYGVFGPVSSESKGASGVGRPPVLVHAHHDEIELGKQQRALFERARVVARVVEKPVCSGSTSSWTSALASGSVFSRASATTPAAL